LDRRLGGPQSRPGRGSEEKNSQPLPGFETPITQPAAHRYTTELYRLLSVLVSISISRLKHIKSKFFLYNTSRKQQRAKHYEETNVYRKEME
jgi:hypothetical protein